MRHYSDEKAINWRAQEAIADWLRLIPAPEGVALIKRSAGTEVFSEDTNNGEELLFFQRPGSCSSQSSIIIQQNNIRKRSDKFSGSRNDDIYFRI